MDHHNSNFDTATKLSTEKCNFSNWSCHINITIIYVEQIWWNYLEAVHYTVGNDWVIIWKTFIVTITSYSLHYILFPCYFSIHCRYWAGQKTNKKTTLSLVPTIWSSMMWLCHQTQDTLCLSPIRMLSAFGRKSKCLLISQIWFLFLRSYFVWNFYIIVLCKSADIENLPPRQTNCLKPLVMNIHL